MKRKIIYLFVIVVFSTNIFAQNSECWEVDIDCINIQRDLYENDIEVYIEKLNNGEIEYNTQYIPENIFYKFHSLFDSLCLKENGEGSEIFTQIDVTFAYSSSFTTKSFISYTDTIQIYNKQISELDLLIDETLSLPIKKMLDDMNISLEIAAEDGTYKREYFMILLLVYLKNGSGNLHLNKFYIPINDDYLYKIEIDYEN